MLSYNAKEPLSFYECDFILHKVYVKLKVRGVRTSSNSPCKLKYRDINSLL